MSRRLLLVEWDAADWKVLHPLIDAGEMPALTRLVENGASGELSCTQPVVAAMLCTSMMTGKRAWQHGVCHSAEPGPNERPVAISAVRRRSAALWQMLAHVGKKSLIIGWPASHNDQTKQSIIVSDRYPEPTAGPGIKPWPPATAGTYWPEEIRSRLDPKRTSSEAIGADVISRYVPAWKKVDQQRDHRLGQLRLFLAADYSYQSAALALLKEAEWDFAAIRFPALAPISRIFLPYHLSKPGETTDHNLEIYQNVIRAGCRILDNMLRQLMEAAGSNTSVVVVSNHGVRTHGVPSHGFPAKDNESWKSPYGIFAASGPEFARDALLHGADILDVAPTILTWFGLPMGDDMEGRVLVESFTSIPEITRIESWDSRIGISPRPADDDSGSTAANRATSALRRESDWNFVQSGMEAGRHEKILSVLERLFREFPERVETGYALFQCQLALNRLTDATETLEVVLESLPAGVAALLPRAELAVAKGDFVSARALAGEIHKLNPTHPLAMRKLGLLLLRLREWDALADVASRALNMDDRDAIAWLGLAAAQLRKGKAKEAEGAAARAIGLKYFLPDAHFILARALVAQGRWLEAKDAMQILLKLQPKNRVATTYFKRIPDQNP